MTDHGSNYPDDAATFDSDHSEHDVWPAHLGPCPPHWDGTLPSGEEIAP
jgi:hypothetical protein